MGGKGVGVWERHGPKWAQMKKKEGLLIACVLRLTVSIARFFRWSYPLWPPLHHGTGANDLEAFLLHLHLKQLPDQSTQGARA